MLLYNVYLCSRSSDDEGEGEGVSIWRKKEEERKQVLQKKLDEANER